MADAINRRRVTAVLDRDRFRIVAAGATVGALLNSARSGFDLALLVGGADLLTRCGALGTLRRLRSDCLAVLIAPDEDRSLVRRAVRAGVDGFVPHTRLEEALEPTLAAVIAGQLTVPRAVRHRIAWSVLSPRERQVLQLVAAGLTNGEIADRLYLSESTVKTHLSSSFRKIGVCSRAEAAAAVLDPEHRLTACTVPAALSALEHELLGGARVQ